MTQEEKIKDLEQRLALMDADNSALAVELEHWKKVAAGTKGRNKQLAERVEHYKNLDLEGDILYEKALAELDAANKEVLSLKLVIDEKEKVVKGLQEQVNDVIRKKNKLEAEFVACTRNLEKAEKKLSELEKPWWKRIF